MSTFASYDIKKYAIFEKLSHGKEITHDEKKTVSPHMSEYSSWFQTELEYQDALLNSYNYLITFTINPNYYDPLDRHDVGYVKNYIIKQLQRAPLKILQAFISEEGDYEPKKKDHKQKHFHVAVSARKSLTKNLFHYYTKTIGHIDFSETRVSSLEEALNYISKDVSPERVV